MIEKFRGSLLGFAVGDALGAPLEFMSREQIQIRHGVVNTMLGGGWLGLRRGETTDDTKLMLCLLESLVDEGEFNPHHVAERYIEWWMSNPRDIGKITRTSLTFLSEGVSIEEAAKRAHFENNARSAGNGPLKSSLPLALFHFQEPELLIQNTWENAQITHYDRKAASAAVTFNLLVAKALAGDRSRKMIVEEVSEETMTRPQGVLPILPEMEGKKKEDLKTGSYIVDTLEAGLWAFLYTENFEDCLVEAVNLGGDTDTIGAVAGALAGAYYGEDSIPDSWTRFLEEKRRIEGNAMRLYEVTTQGG